MILSILFVIAGFALLMKGADVFVEGSSKIALKFNVPQIVIGLTIVAFGTSLPEAAVSLTAAAKSTAGIAVGNVIGSNIMNVLVILGLSALFSILKIKDTTVKFEMPFLIGVSVLLGVLGYFGNSLSRLDGVILWIVFLIFFMYLIYLSKTQDNEDEEELTKKDTMLRLIIFVILGAGCIVLGSNLAVSGATKIAEMLGMSDRIIGLTIVAFGTSLPELVTSVVASRKGKADIAVGNIIGSNLFNLLFVLGTVSLICPISFTASFYFDAVICIFAVVLLFLLSIKKKQLDRKAGIIFLICYAGYFIHLLG